MTLARPEKPSNALHLRAIAATMLTGRTYQKARDEIIDSLVAPDADWRARKPLRQRLDIRARAVFGEDLRPDAITLRLAAIDPRLPIWCRNAPWFRPDPAWLEHLTPNSLASWLDTTASALAPRQDAAHQE